MMEAGSDTTASTLLSFLVAMVKYPDVLRKAQQAVDQACGTARSLSFSDLDRLEYPTCIMQEVWRRGPAC